MAGEPGWGQRLADAIDEAMAELGIETGYDWSEGDTADATG